MKHLLLTLLLAFVLGGCGFLGPDQDNGSAGGDGSGDGSGDNALVESRP